MCIHDYCAIIIKFFIDDKEINILDVIEQGIKPARKYFLACHYCGDTIQAPDGFNPGEPTIL